jgi:putative DNA primase/helicase
VRERAKDVVRKLYHEAGLVDDGAERKALASWAIKTENEKLQRAMLTLAQSAVPILPEQFDTDPWLFNVENGTLDLRSRELRPHRRADFITKLCPTIYDPAAECPHFREFLMKIFENDWVLLNWLQKLLGSVLVGKLLEQILVIFWGAGANGKTTLVRVLMHVLGEDYAQPAPMSTFLVKRDGIPNDVARLFNTRAVFASESGAGRRLDEALVKQLTGGDKITARFLKAEFFSFDPTFTVILSTNHKPEIRGIDHAIWRRVRLVPFTVIIPEAEQEKDFAERVLFPEAPGILAWLVDGCQQWQCEGLGDLPKLVKDATEDYRRESDVLADFLDAECIVDKEQMTTASALYNAYLEHCKETNEKDPISKKDFGQRLDDKGFIRGKITGGTRVWKGLRFR